MTAERTLALLAMRCTPMCAQAAALCHLASLLPFHPAPHPCQVYYLHRLPFLQQSTFPTLLGWLRLLRLIVIRERITLVHGHQVGACGCMGTRWGRVGAWAPGGGVWVHGHQVGACGCMGTRW